MKAALILLAGGLGRRFAGSTKKQYTKIGEEYLLDLTLRKFADVSDISERILVVPADDIETVKKEFSETIEKYKVKKVVTGGSERVYSVINGVNSVDEDADFLIIHDSVRPFIDKEVIVAGLKIANVSGAAIAAVKIKDTLKKVSPNVKDSGISEISETIDRSSLWAAQTPQIFSKDLFAKAIRNWQEIGEPAVTDDAMLVELLGKKVSIVKSSELNIKITQPEDIILAEAIQKIKNK